MKIEEKKGDMSFSAFLSELLLLEDYLKQKVIQKDDKELTQPWEDLPCAKRFFTHENVYCLKKPEGKPQKLLGRTQCVTCMRLRRIKSYNGSKFGDIIYGGT